MKDYDQLSARALAKAIRKQKISSLEATKEAIERLKAAHEITHCLLSLEADAALKAAKAVDAEIDKGKHKLPLDGVPLAHKDMFDRKGKIATWGARIRAEQPAKQDATVIGRLKEAGALQIATLHLTEFAFGPTGHNYVLGHARNPWDPSRITGGSSAGTAAAVAYGAIPAGLGSDTGGSLRLPAACCGVTSIKPTWGRVSRAGAMPLAPALDTIGVVARHVEDLALMMRVMAGHDARDAGSSSVKVPDYVDHLDDGLKGVKLGIDAAVNGQASGPVQKMLDTVTGILTGLGLRKVDATFPDWQTMDHLTQLVQQPDAAAAHDHYLRTRADDYGPQVRARLEIGHFIPAVAHLTALRARGTYLQRTIDSAFKTADVVLLPVLADPLPTIAELDVGGGPNTAATLGRVIKFTRVINYLGLPALTLPVPRGSGLPNGFQLVGKPYSEALLLAIGQAYQQEVPPEVARLVKA
ncbi:MAG: amidase [Hyphomicrobiaceae bacterium]|nr:amidase [Hyphomicrobiaceae bacterium]